MPTFRATNTTVGTLIYDAPSLDTAQLDVFTDATELSELSPAGAWEIYVGEQTPEAFAAAGSVANYVSGSPLCEDLAPADDATDSRAALVELLQAHIDNA